MINEGRLVDSLIVFKILKLLTTPIENSDAFNYGIIDANGKKIKEPTGAQELESYTILNRLIFKIQYALMKSPDRTSKRLLTLTAALAILREHSTKDFSTYTVEDINALLDMYETDEKIIAESILLERNTVTFKTFREEMAANAVGGGNIAGIGVGNKGEPGVDPRLMPMIRRRKKKDAYR